jgi:hypothetical protein
MDHTWHLGESLLRKSRGGVGGSHRRHLATVVAWSFPKRYGDSRWIRSASCQLRGRWNWSS